MLRLRDIMTTDVLTVTPSTSLQEAADLFTARHVGGAPVVEGTRVVGVVSASDILGFVTAPPAVPREAAAEDDADEDDDPSRDWPDEEGEPSGRFFTDLWIETRTEVPERIDDRLPSDWDVLAAHTVEEVMTRDVRALPPSADVSAAVALMRSADVHRVLVMDGPTLLGIVTTVDVARAISDGRLVRRTFVFG
jgi:CBS domain-containing protein